MAVALRRLFAIMYVKNVTCHSGGAPCAAAWLVVGRILEIHPAANIRVPTLDSMWAREAAASFKAMNAVVALGKGGTAERRTPTRDPETKRDEGRS